MFVIVIYVLCVESRCSADDGASRSASVWWPGQSGHPCPRHQEGLLQEVPLRAFPRWVQVTVTCLGYSDHRLLWQRPGSFYQTVHEQVLNLRVYSTCTSKIVFMQRGRTPVAVNNDESHLVRRKIYHQIAAYSKQLSSTRSTNLNILRYWE